MELKFPPQGYFLEGRGAKRRCGSIMKFLSYPPLTRYDDDDDDDDEEEEEEGGETHEGTEGDNNVGKGKS